MEEYKKTKSKYSLKKTKMKGGSYSGSSPFFSNIPEYQYIKPLESYSHIRELMKNYNFFVPRKRDYTLEHSGGNR